MAIDNKEFITKDIIESDIAYVRGLPPIEEEIVKAIIDSEYDLASLMWEDSLCPYCKGKGDATKEGGVCSHCNTKTKTLLEKDYWKINDNYLNIPPNFLKKWDSSAILSSIEGTRSINTKQLNEYRDLLKDMHNFLFNFEAVHVHKCNYIYCAAGPVVEPLLWLYNILQLYKFKGYSVSPLITLNEINMEEDMHLNYNVMLIALTQYDRKNTTKLDAIITQRYFKGLNTLIYSPVPRGSFDGTGREKLMQIPTLDITQYVW